MLLTDIFAFCICGNSLGTVVLPFCWLLTSGLGQNGFEQEVGKNCGTLPETAKAFRLERRKQKDWNTRRETKGTNVYASSTRGPSLVPDVAYCYVWVSTRQRVAAGDGWWLISLLTRTWTRPTNNSASGVRRHETERGWQLPLSLADRSSSRSFAGCRDRRVVCVLVFFWHSHSSFERHS